MKHNILHKTLFRTFYILSVRYPKALNVEKWLENAITIRLFTLTDCIISLTSMLNGMVFLFPLLCYLVEFWSNADRDKSVYRTYWVKRVFSPVEAWGGKMSRKGETVQWATNSKLLFELRTEQHKQVHRKNMVFRRNNKRLDERRTET